MAGSAARPPRTSRAPRRPCRWRPPRRARPRSSPVIGCTMAILSRRRLTVLPEPHAILGRQVDDDARGIDEDDVAARGRRCARGRARRRRCASRWTRRPTEPRDASASGAMFSSLYGPPCRGLIRPPPGGRAVLGDHLRRRDQARLAEDQRLHGGGDLVLLDPDVLGLARHVAEARVLDQEPLAARSGGSRCSDRSAGRSPRARAC